MCLELMVVIGVQTAALRCVMVQSEREDHLLSSSGPHQSASGYLPVVLLSPSFMRKLLALAERQMWTLGLGSLALFLTGGGRCFLK